MLGLLNDLLLTPSDNFSNENERTVVTLAFGPDSFRHAEALAIALKLYLRSLHVRQSRVETIREIENAVKEGRPIVVRITVENVETMNGPERIAYVCVAGEKRNECVRVMRRAYMEFIEWLKKKREECVKKALCSLAEFDRSNKDAIVLSLGKPCRNVLSVFVAPLTKEEIADEVVRQLSKCPPEAKLPDHEVRKRILDVLGTCETPEQCVREILLRHPLPDGNKRASFIVGVVGRGITPSEWCKIVRKELNVPCRVT